MLSEGLGGTNQKWICSHFPHFLAYLKSFICEFVLVPKGTKNISKYLKPYPNWPKTSYIIQRTSKIWVLPDPSLAILSIFASLLGYMYNLCVSWTYICAKFKYFTSMKLYLFYYVTVQVATCKINSTNTDNTNRNFINLYLQRLESKWH